MSITWAYSCGSGNCPKSSWILKIVIVFPLLADDIVNVPVQIHEIIVLVITVVSPVF